MHAGVPHRAPANTRSAQSRFNPGHTGLGTPGCLKNWMHGSDMAQIGNSRQNSSLLVAGQGWAGVDSLFICHTSTPSTHHASASGPPEQSTHLKTSGLWSYSTCELHTVSLHLVAASWRGTQRAPHCLEILTSPHGVQHDQESYTHQTSRSTRQGQ